MRESGKDGYGAAEPETDGIPSARESRDRGKLGDMRCGLLLAGLLAAPAFAQVTSRASVSSSGAQSTGDLSSWLSVKLSADGRFVVFVSEAPGLVPGDTKALAAS